MWIEFGRRVYDVKWNMNGCDIIGAGRKLEDEWKESTKILNSEKKKEKSGWLW